MREKIASTVYALLALTVWIAGLFLFRWIVQVLTGFNEGKLLLIVMSIYSIVYLYLIANYGHIIDKKLRIGDFNSKDGKS